MAILDVMQWKNDCLDVNFNIVVVYSGSSLDIGSNCSRENWHEEEDGGKPEWV